jgi:hypothetical protein
MLSQLKNAKRHFFLKKSPLGQAQVWSNGSRKGFLSSRKWPRAVLKRETGFFLLLQISAVVNALSLAGVSSPFLLGEGRVNSFEFCV